MTNDFEKLIITTPEVDQRIQDGIEKYRKGNFTVRFPDEYKGKKVQVKLKNHKFRFGANLFMLDEFSDDEKKNEIYREKFKEVFNLATLPFYWDATEPEEGKTRYHKTAEKVYRRPPIDLCIDYCLENGIEPREHALCYAYFFPKWMEGKTFEEFKPYMEKRMQEVSTRYADKIPTMEVTNEMFWNAMKCDFYFRDDFIEYCFKLADEYFPNNKLAINEWAGVWTENATDRDPYYAYIRDTLNRGCRVDVIGMQFHMFYRLEEYFKYTRDQYTLERAFKLLDKYSDFKKGLEITEVTIPAYTQDPEKEEEQADIIEKLYSLWFSHEKMEKIIYWNLVDGYAAFTEAGNMEQGENYYRGGLLRFDMSEKPAFKRLKKLIKEVWTTNEELTVDENGCVNFRGFYGEYEIIAAGNKAEVKLFDDNAKERVTI